MKLNILSAAFLSLVFSCKKPGSSTDFQKDLEYSVKNVGKTLNKLPETEPNLPRNITDESGKWNYISYKDWTSGFWPGTLWYAFEASGDEKLK